jgi:cell division protein ZapA (FtsZ GTPase activity inhibitor)
LWAEFSEKLSDVIDPSIKYGGGEDSIRAALQASTMLMAEIENIELKYADLEKEAIDNNEKKQLNELQDMVAEAKRKLAENLKKFNEPY